MLPSVLAQLGETLINASEVRVRAAWCRDRGQIWRLRMLEIIEGAEPRGGAAMEWHYTSAAFSACEVPGTRVGDWINKGVVSTVDGWEHALGQSAEPLNWERRESQAKSGYGTLGWPTYEVQLGNLQAIEPPGMILSDRGAPSFASFQSAALAFFGLGANQPGLSLPTFAIFRCVDTRARINRVKIAEEEVQVEIEGTSLDSLTVEMASDIPGPTEIIKTRSSTATVTFPLPNGLPPGAWVVIRAGAEWLDRRFLTWPWAGKQEAGVTFDVTVKTKVEAFLAARESDTVEFKQQIPDADSTKAKAMKTVCAFANGSGGSLLFGITDDYEVVGLPVIKATKFMDTLSELVDAWVEPVPSYSFEVLPVDGTNMAVIELTVNAGLALFGSSKPNEPRRVYVRHHSRSVPARVREIEEIVRARATSPTLGWRRPM